MHRYLLDDDPIALPDQEYATVEYSNYVDVEFLFQAMFSNTLRVSPPTVLTIIVEFIVIMEALQSL